MHFLSERKNRLRILFCVLGNVLIGLGVAFTKIAAFGNDSFNGMNMSVSHVLGMDYVVYTWIFNLALFLLEVIFGRKYIFIGTFLNWFMVSFFASFFLSPLTALFPVTPAFIVRILLMMVGLFICALGLALYQGSDLGISPYDVLPIMFCNRHPKVKYIWARLTLDVSACLIIFLTGGLLGIGTVVNALFTGPLVHLYTEGWHKLTKSRQH